MPQPYSIEQPFRVAIVGAGPSGFYAADALLSSDIPVVVNIFDRLPSPFGLVRYGVAPDHQKIKNVIRMFEKTAVNERFSFYGNVEVGKDITVQDLQRTHDALMFTCGAETDRKLGIPGEELAGSHTATEFVGWYNGHPDYRDRQFDISQEVAVIIGQGNVAMDVGRILCKTVDELKETDIARHALEVLAESRIREIHLIGRRGPMQAAFTSPEIREMGELTDCDVHLNPKDLELNKQSRLEFEDTHNAVKIKNYKILEQFAQKILEGKSRQFHVHFLKSPLEIKGDNSVQKILLGRNELIGEAGKQKASLTESREELACGLVFRSVGYRGVAIEGVPFDEQRGIFSNEDGRITNQGAVVPGFYAAGWIKRGPSGVIGTNKPDAEHSVKLILEDSAGLEPCPVRDNNTLEKCLRDRGVCFVTYADWKKIDAAEIAEGQKDGKPREKFVTVEEMLAVLK